MCEWLKGAQGFLSTADLCRRKVRKGIAGEKLMKTSNIPNISPEINAKFIPLFREGRGKVKEKGTRRERG